MSTITVPPYLNMNEDVYGLHRAFKGVYPSLFPAVQIYEEN